jgi:hypothetical protein
MGEDAKSGYHRPPQEQQGNRRAPDDSPAPSRGTACRKLRAPQAQQQQNADYDSDERQPQSGSPSGRYGPFSLAAV